MLSSGTERVILIQEQISKNRMLIEKDSKDRFQCTVTRYFFVCFSSFLFYFLLEILSTTQQTKTKTAVYESKGRYFLAHNSLVDVRISKKKNEILLSLFYRIFRL